MTDGAGGIALGTGAVGGAGTAAAAAGAAVAAAAGAAAATAAAAAADSAARVLALDPSRSILLEAPAGSGKTTVLTQRLLALLATVEEPEAILAITFTRKAAAEMRDRVVRALRGEIDTGSAHGRKIRELAEAVNARSRRLGWSLDAHPSRLRIQTIDSLNRWLASQRPLAARGAAELEIAQSPLRLYRMAARQTLLDAQGDAALEADAGLLFERLDNDFGRFERLLAEMLAKRAHWLPRLLSEESLAERVESSLRAIVGERLRRAQALLPRALVAQGARRAHEAARRRAAARDGRPGPWRIWIHDPPDGDALSLRHWQGLAQLALTTAQTWRLTLTQREGFPKEERDSKREASEWIAQLSGITGARELLAELANLPEPQIPADDALALAALARVLRLAAGELELTFAERRRVDYPYVAAAARRALTEEGAPTDLALRIGTDIRHLLIDEFQDTSLEQLALIEALTAGWETGDGRTLFVVGDPMQSIYQFREAEVGLFLRAATQGVGGLTLERASLTRNFRSAPELVAWLNATFPACFPASDDARTSAVAYRRCVGGPARPGGLVGLHATSGDPEEEARAVAALVSQMRRAEPQASIAVLLASRSHAAPIFEALAAAGVPAAGLDLRSLADLRVVQDLEALTRALDHLADRTAWLAVLRAPWCGLTLAELSLLLEDAPQQTVWESMHDVERAARLPPPALERLSRARAALSSALEQRDRIDIASRVERGWLALGGPAVCADEADLAHAGAFLEGLSRWSREPGWPGPLGLQERLGELRAAEPAHPAGAIEIMTIHRAKGLEFDRVIVPALGRSLRSSSEPLLRWLDLPAEHAGSDLIMAAIPSAGDSSSPLGEYLKRLEAERTAHERVRLLYVAATRARRELHLFGELPKPPAGSDGRGRGRSPPAALRPRSGTLLAALWPGIAEAFLQESDRVLSGGGPGRELPDRLDSERPSEPATAPGSLERLSAGWRLPVVPEGPRHTGLESIASGGSGAEPLILESEPAIARVMCDQLRRCARLGRLPSRDESMTRPFKERLERLGLADAELERAAGLAAERFAACLEDPRLAWIFSPTHARAESPLALTGVEGSALASVSIDRTFVDANGVRWLIEFRAGHAGDGLGGGDEEIERGIALAGALWDEPVRGGVYFPAEREFREVVLRLSRG